MKVTKFHRVRANDGARASVDRVTCDVIGTEAAIKLTGPLLCSLALPQQPDAATMWDEGSAAQPSTRRAVGRLTRNSPSPSNGNEVYDHDTHFPQ